MLPPGGRTLATLVAVTLVATVQACSSPRPSATPPPRSEFLLNTADSTFWVKTGAQTSVRGAPLVLAAYDRRFYELYTADDDYSYPDATLLGERLYRRDLLTGDSMIVFSDTTVPRIAAAYAKAHPDERPLNPDDEGDEDPKTSATAELDVLGVFGPYLSYEYHVDVETPNAPPWHAITARRSRLAIGQTRARRRSVRRLDRCAPHGDRTSGIRRDARLRAGHACVARGRRPARRRRVRAPRLRRAQLHADQRRRSTGGGVRRSGARRRGRGQSRGARAAQGRADPLVAKCGERILHRGRRRQRSVDRQRLPDHRPIRHVGRGGAAVDCRCVTPRVAARLDDRAVAPRRLARSSGDHGHHAPRVVARV